MIQVHDEAKGEGTSGGGQFTCQITWKRALVEMKEI
jgi:hypothetical protein